MRFNSLFLVAAVSAGLAACERPGEPATDSQPTAPSFQALPGDDWGPAVRLSSPWPNTAALEGCPHESTDGRSLYFASNRNGSNDIFVSHRDASGAWGEPVALDAVNSFSLLMALSPVFFGAAFDGARRSATCLISA